MKTEKLSRYILIILNIISMVLIAQIDLRILPLVPNHINNNRVQRINDLFSNLSQGVIISTFFFWVLVYIPNKRRSRIVRKLIQPRLDTIVTKMQNSIAYFIHKYNIKNLQDHFNGLTIKDFSKIERIGNTKMNFNYRVKYTKNNYWTPFSSGELTEISNFKHERIIVKEKIDEIFSIPIISAEEDLLIETLAKLRDCWFYSGILAYASTGEKAIVYNFNEAVFEYYWYFSILSKYVDLPEFKLNAD
ncbi:MAG: hypothetical protein M9898_14905 [Chitinophagaceae bacterium]|nr:hypothetical protein [Chitinophagaceae bacterium]